MLDKFKFNSKEDNAVVVAPQVNIYDQNNDIVLAVEMPGADKGSLDVNLDASVLSITGRRKKEDIGREYELLYQERPPVEYRRSFELNADVDRENLRAEYVDGVLKVFLKKQEKALPKKINITL